MEGIRECEGERRNLSDLGVSAVKKSYRRGAEDAEVGPGGAGPYRGLNVQLPSGKNLSDLGVSAVKHQRMAEFFSYRRGAEGAEGVVERGRRVVERRIRMRIR